MDRNSAAYVPAAFSNLMDPPSPIAGGTAQYNTNSPTAGLKPLKKLSLPPMAFVDPATHHSGGALPSSVVGGAPFSSSDAVGNNNNNDYTALLRKLKAKERPPPMVRGDLEGEPPQGLPSPGVYRSQSVPRQRRGSLPETANKYVYDISPSNSASSPSSINISSGQLLANRRQSQGLPTARQPGGGGPLSSGPPAAGYESEGGYFSDVSRGAMQGGGAAEPPQRRKGRIKVVVRKRPVPAGEEDVVEVDPPVIHVNAQKLRIDLSEYTEAYQYSFDDAFASDHNNAYVYEQCGTSLIDTVFEGGSASCFAYGQTGSGKTHTMLGTESDMGFYLLAAKDIFERCSAGHKVSVSLFEIYCNSLFDLLNTRSVVIPREDANKRVVICGLTWKDISSVADLAWWIERGSEQRRTGSTSANEFSSRSHAVMTISVRNERDKSCGSLKLVDLAGSERAADTAAHDRQTRLEGAEINKSLLALKECIRGLDERKKHIPFRGSKLTEVLRDSFEGNSRTVMIAAVTPAASSVVHTLNTLRYAFRVKGLSIDQNVVPSKQRKSKVAPAIRSKSTEPSPPPPYSILAQPLPPLFGSPNQQQPRDASPSSGRVDASSGAERDASGRRIRKHRKAKSSRVLAGQQGDAGASKEEVMSAIQVKVGVEIAGLRSEMMGVIHKKDEEIDRLAKRNDDLERRLEKLLDRIAKTETAMAQRREDGERSSSQAGGYESLPSNGRGVWDDDGNGLY